ncbi:MAG: RIO1 family regulatory kinase/ATPase [Anaerolineaceae bacterium]
MSLVSESPEPSRFANRESDRSDMAAIQEFLDAALITEVLNVVKSGKEATVYRCRAHKSLGVRYAIAKVYHSHAHRGFQRGAMYEEGRVILEGQVRRAVAARTEFGRNAQSAMWVDHEFDLLSSLNYAGADVPTPFVCNERAILMEEVGDANGPATQLQHTRLSPDEAQPLLDRLLWNIELMMKENVVHSDLSPFNILYSGGRCIIIDLPQAVDPRQNSQAEKLLERDLTNVVRHFTRYNVEPMDPRQMAHNLFELWRHGEL